MKGGNEAEKGERHQGVKKVAWSSEQCVGKWSLKNSLIDDQMAFRKAMCNVKY